MNRVRIIETGKRFGNMNTGKNFFGKENVNCPTKRRELFLENRKKAAKHYGFDPYKFYMPSQQKDGSYQVLTEEMVAATQDGWDLDIPADILIVTDRTPNVVVGYPVADCAVVIMSDLKNGMTATAHCAAEFVDRRLPQMTLEALKSEINSKEDDISVYVSACAGNSWVYHRFPSWATDAEIWERSGAIVEDHGMYRIDLRKAILAQLEVNAFHQFLMNPADTITNDHYFSNHAANCGDETKLGRHFAGAFYQKVRK